MTSENLTPEQATKKMQENIHDPRIVEQMILLGADVNEPIYSGDHGEEFSPVELCLLDYHDESARLLIRDNKTKITADAISYAITHWRPELLELMIKEHPESSRLISESNSLLPDLLGSIDLQDFDTLFGSGRETQNKLLTLLLDNGAKAQEKDSRGNTILHDAVERNALHLCKKLLQKSDEIGLDIAAINQDGETALHKIASLINYSETLDRARQRMSPEEFQDINSDITSDRESLDYLMQKLSNKGVDINQKNNSGDTALHIAIQQDRVDKNTLLLMVKSGADINIKNNSGQTPLDLLEGQKVQWRADLRNAYIPKRKSHPRISNSGGANKGMDF